MNHFFVGVDLGQVHNPSTIAIVEHCKPVMAGFDYLNWMRTQHSLDPLYDVRHLERIRLGTTYPDVVRRVEEVVRRPEIRGHCTVVPDGTGVGRAVLDLFREAKLDCELVPVNITHGTTAHRDGSIWNVSKRDLISVVQVLLHRDRLRFAAHLPEVKRLIDEMMSMRTRLTGEGNEQFGAWREGTHDDLALAVALACWRAQRNEVPIGEQSGRLL